MTISTAYFGRNIVVHFFVIGTHSVWVAKEKLTWKYYQMIFIKRIEGA